jgi:peptidoglycan/LPS O-acetylase OafA/YrhL
MSAERRQLPPREPSAAPAYALSLGGGAILWISAAVLGGRTEAWDSPLYWSVAYPLGVVLAGALGYKFPEKAWRWAPAMMLAQACVLAVTAADFSLLPLGLILFGVLALPPMAVALAAARIRRRRTASGS